MIEVTIQNNVFVTKKKSVKSATKKHTYLRKSCHTKLIS